MAADASVARFVDKYLAKPYADSLMPWMSFTEPSRASGSSGFLTSHTFHAPPLVVFESAREK